MDKTLYVIWLSVYMIFWGNPNAHNIIISLAFLDGWFHFWFLWIMFISYLLFPFILRSINHNLIIFSFVLLSVIICSTLLSDVTLSNSYTVNFIFKNKILILPINIIYFCIGIIVSSYVKEDIFSFSINNLFVVLLALTYIICIYNKMHNYYNVICLLNFIIGFSDIVFNSISILFIIRVVNFIENKLNKTTFALSILGISSYGIYLSHIVILYISRNLLDGIFLKSSTLYAFFSCILFSYMLSRLLTNNKLGMILGF